MVQFPFPTPPATPLFRLPVVVAVAALLTTALHARPGDSTESAAGRSPVLLGGFLGPVFGISSPEFADAYTQFGGGPFSMDAPLSIGASTKTTVGDGLRAGASVEAYRGRFQDNYTQVVATGSGDTVLGFRNIYQDMQVKVLPVFVTLEVVPVQAQFRTYAGIGVGLAYTEVFWQETVTSTLFGDRRTGGLHIDEQRFAPAFRLYTGVELGFDRERGQAGLHSLTIEARYSYIPLSLPLLAGVAAQVDDAPEHWREPMTLTAGGLSLAVGVVVQFLR